jgi:hypothetical protein
VFELASPIATLRNADSQRWLAIHQPALEERTVVAAITEA